MDTFSRQFSQCVKKSVFYLFKLFFFFYFTLIKHKLTSFNSSIGMIKGKVRTFYMSISKYGLFAKCRNIYFIHQTHTRTQISLKIIVLWTPYLFQLYTDQKPICCKNWYFNANHLLSQCNFEHINSSHLFLINLPH